MPITLGLDTNLLQNGPIPKIVERCRRYVLAGTRASRLGIFLNDVSVNTPTENTHAAIAAIRYFARNPQANLQSFSMPEMETFENFLRKRH